MNATLARPAVDSVTELPESTLETCDKCGVGVQARVRVLLSSGNQLTFCGHDANELGYVPTS